MDQGKKKGRKGKERGKGLFGGKTPSGFIFSAFSTLSNKGLLGINPQTPSPLRAD
jgi:hypothetical protein